MGDEVGCQVGMGLECWLTPVIGWLARQAHIQEQEGAGV